MPPNGPRLTLSVVSADVGGFIGHISSHPDILDTAKERLFLAREKKIITDFHVLRCGDDLGIILVHQNGPKNKAVTELIWHTLNACAEAARELRLYKAGEDILKGVSGAEAKGPAAAEIEFAARTSEPVIVFMANKTSVGAWNLPAYKIFADPFNTAGLVTDPLMQGGFSFNVLDIKEDKEITLTAPADIYSLLALVGTTSRYVVTSASRNSDNEIASAIAVRKLSESGIASASRDNPVMIMRCQAGLPAVGEALEAFSLPHLVGGWLRESHNGPLMPVPFYEANPSRFDGPPRLIGAGFQISNGRLIGPHDMFDDPSFDETRRLANQITEYIRRHGPFQPHRLPLEELGQTGFMEVLDKIKTRFSR